MAARSIKEHHIVAVDTGGTFTDFYCLDGAKVRIHKVLSTPEDPSKAILHGLKELGIQSDMLVHGSTVATNALLEHKGAPIALVTTAGFEDVIEIGRQERSELYNIQCERQTPLVAKAQRFGITERLNSNGRVITPLKKSELSALAKKLKASKTKAVAICLLNSYASERHESEVATALAKIGKPVSLSSQICPEFREYERTSTTCANATLTPIMSKYLTRLQERLSQPIRVMQSNGGSLTVNEASEEAVRTLLSGPAGGALGALQAAQKSGYKQLLALDMGGTSTDLTLIDGKIELTSEANLEGYPIKTPMIRIHTIGAGGGSIARVDAGGALQVGPESAGAAPGPLCYDQGGKDCTITDAHLYLGRIHPDYFLGGQMTLKPKRVTKPLQQLARQLKLSSEATADGIIQVANAHMARALRVISLERGYDPRHFSLVAFGGAGALHACELATALEIPRVIVPAHPGILSAYGMAYADWKRDYVQTILWPETKATQTALQKIIGRLKQKSGRDATRAAYKKTQLMFQAELDVRYQGQSYELRVPLNARFKQAFAKLHRQQFGYVHHQPLEVVNVRLQARVKPAHRERAVSTVRPSKKIPKAVTTSQLHWGQKTHQMNWYERPQLVSGNKIRGPAVIAEFSATTFVPPGWELECDKVGNLILWPRKK